MKVSRSPRRWLLARNASGTSWRCLARELGVSAGCLVHMAAGRRPMAPAVIAAWRVQRGPAPSTMRQLLPRLVRWLRSRQIVEQNKPRVYARSGARVEL